MQGSLTGVGVCGRRAALSGSALAVGDTAAQGRVLPVSGPLQILPRSMVLVEQGTWAQCPPRLEVYLVQERRGGPFPGSAAVVLAYLAAFP